MLGLIARWGHNVLLMSMGLLTIALVISGLPRGAGGEPLPLRRLPRDENQIPQDDSGENEHPNCSCPT
jgi:hypothetical protein